MKDSGHIFDGEFSLTKVDDVNALLSAFLRAPKIFAYFESCDIIFVEWK